MVIAQQRAPLRTAFSMPGHRGSELSHEVTSPGVGMQVTCLAVRGFFEELLAALPDGILTPERILADAEYATVQWRMAGTFGGGPFQEIRATGRPVEVRGVDVMHIVDGRLLDNTIYYDGLSFARQIGLLPTAGSRSDRALVSAFNAQTVLRSALPRLPGRG